MLVHTFLLRSEVVGEDNLNAIDAYRCGVLAHFDGLLSTGASGANKYRYLAFDLFHHRFHNSLTLIVGHGGELAGSAQGVEYEIPASGTLKQPARVGSKTFQVKATVFIEGCNLDDNYPFHQLFQVIKLHGHYLQ